MYVNRTGLHDKDLSNRPCDADAVRAIGLRDEYAADLVALVTERMKRFCGLPYYGSTTVIL